jgi:8-oxo-dGTP pyrophosphatase MutT (NUDIX family)/diadenosine tetraphosphate (Ap4A) HIT family hydrolase
MPAWDDAERWRALRDSAGCPICSDGPADVLVDLDATWVTAGAEAPLPGYACVISKRHAVEPYHLPDRGLAFWADAMWVAEALDAHLAPIKMNYEVHGNTIPHLHLHLFPRHPGDPFAGRPIGANEVHAHRTADELDAMRAAIAGSTQPAAPPMAAVGAVIRRGEEVLLARHRYHADKRYVLIAGYVQPGESFEGAAAREVAEETGFEVAVERLLGSYPWRSMDMPIVFVACETRVIGGSLRLDDELEDARWFRLDALPEWPPEFPVARVFEKLRSRRENGVS